MRLKISADVLPKAAPTPCHPFSGYVVNVNVATGTHRDPLDDEICGVFIIGKHKGGELVLYEPGIILELKNGNMVVFRSTDVTHFNLHYTGTRAAIDLNTYRF